MYERKTVENGKRYREFGSAEHGDLTKIGNADWTREKNISDRRLKVTRELNTYGVPQRSGGSAVEIP